MTYGTIDFDGSDFYATYETGLVAIPLGQFATESAAIDAVFDLAGGCVVRILAGSYPHGTRETGSIIA